LTVDLSQLTFIDSTGVGILLRLSTEAERVGKRLAIVRAQPDVQRVFVIAGLGDALPFTDPPD
jgi:anti-anti-sigma factor